MTTRPQAATYTFNVRSFHPKTHFGWSGLYFSGDNRGFSLKPSGKGKPSSKIWHEVKIDMKYMVKTDAKTNSDPSKAYWSDQKFPYDDPILKPKDQIFVLPPKKTAGLRTFAMKGKYSGSNHAMPLSPEMKKKTGFTYVPEIDVQYEMYIKLNLDESWLEVGAHITGDGFPNTEAFITDSKGNAVFLGTHVRQGAAPTSLAANYTHTLIKNVIRVPLNVHGYFKDTLTDEGNRYVKNLRKAQEYRISDWNKRFLEGDPDKGHCMGLEELKRFSECF